MSAARHCSMLTLASLRGAEPAAYPHQVRCYIAWLRASSPVDGDPLADAGTPDWAVRDHKRHLNAVERSRPASVNPALIKSV